MEGQELEVDLYGEGRAGRRGGPRWWGKNVRRVAGPVATLKVLDEPRG